MVLLSSIKACMPWLPISAAVLLTLRSPASIVLDVQAEKLPDSKPSAKIWSDPLGVLVGVDVGPAVFVGVGVAVAVGVGVLVGVGEGPAVFVPVAVGVGVLVAVLVGVGVCVGVFVAPGVLVGVAVGIDPAAMMLMASTSLPDKPKALPSKYNAV